MLFLFLGYNLERTAFKPELTVEFNRAGGIAKFYVEIKLHPRNKRNLT